ncbi:hypothetical protein E2562_030892 [Oryza meyeriana var. granulata]|uniref:F-box associated beta-propeller type 3 domain-containing protein n=1 Tax=Oryza meyeriana var. granulata TaxID=110450 RepID=A0A6G1F0A6_9ORYZ|nr:hypothetical protein E2562_030892 [Oryza meyeriana var. granulata]
MHDGGGQKKIIFTTGTCKVFAVDLDGAGAPPEILFTPEDTTAGGCRVYYHRRLGLYEESLVPVGRTIEEIVFSSPVTTAWSDILKWLPAWSVTELSLVCRESRAMVTTNRFVRSHAVHANLIAKHPRIMLAMDYAAGEFADLDDLIISGNRPQICTSRPFVCSQPCHGLNLGRYRSSEFVFNPCTGYQALLHIDEHDIMGRTFTGVSALGYDAAIGRHVVAHLDYRERNFQTRGYKMRCRTLLVGDGDVAGWKCVKSPPRPVDLDVPPAYANGKIYWVVDSRLSAPPSSEAATCELLALDMEARRFEVIRGPPRRHGDGRMTLLELHGALCVACSDWVTEAINMWMVKDDGAWSLKYRIELMEFSPEYLSETTTPMAFDPMDGQILLNTGTSLGYYDPKTAALETIFSVVDVPENVDGLKYRFCPVICQESLVCPRMGMLINLQILE